MIFIVIYGTNQKGIYTIQLNFFNKKLMDSDGKHILSRYGWSETNSKALFPKKAIIYECTRSIFKYLCVFLSRSLFTFFITVIFICK